MRRFLMFALLSAISCSGFSQDEEKRQGRTSFFAEGGGAGIAFSANIDHRFKQSHLGFGGRLGVGFVTAYNDYYDPMGGQYVWGDQESAITVPIQLNYIFGKENSPHTFEVGGGLTYVSKKLSILNYYDEDRSNLFGTFAFMYRRQPRNGGFTWRAGFTPLIAKGLIQPFGGASVGFNF
jgi:hypothetical protein